jgi:hypothetical protein
MSYWLAQMTASSASTDINLFWPAQNDVTYNIAIIVFLAISQS